MRELRFRQPLLNPDGSFNKFHYWGIFPDEFVGRELSGWVKGDDQQYIGHKDDNDKEVYEGDICLIYLKDALAEVMIVKWDCEKAGFRFYDEEGISWQVTGTLIEVIGHVYEQGRRTEW